LTTNEKLDQRLNCIHNNPVPAGIVSYRKIIFTAVPEVMRSCQQFTGCDIDIICNATLKIVMMKGTSEPRAGKRTTLAPATAYMKNEGTE
jgi:hypothetical protein